MWNLSNLHLGVILQEDEQEAYLFHATGFYTSLSEEGRATAGRWTERLEPKERSLRKVIYALEDYHSKDRTRVLS